MKEKRNVKAFTLVELMVVIAIISALMALVLPSFLGMIERAHNAADLTNIHNLMNAVNKAVISNEDDGFYDNCWYDPNKSKNDAKNNFNNGMGYIYVDNDEVRVSNMAIAKMLEELGYIKDAEHPDKHRGSVNENCYTIQGSSRLRCQSSKAWCRYQLNFRRHDDTGNLEWGITCATKNYSSSSFHEDAVDGKATKDMAERVGAVPIYKDLGGLV